jgi:ankyrin repeat domain-containing protein 50
VLAYVPVGQNRLATLANNVHSSNVLEHITTEFAMRDRVGISFAYYNYRKPELGDPRLIIGALIKQLCQKKDSIPPELLNLMHDSHSKATASNPDSFISLAESFEEVFIVLDALDECPGHERHRIIGFISKIVAELQCAKVFITSRREADILEAFEGKTSTIQIEARSVAADIALHVRDEVTKLRKGYNGKRLYLTSDKLQGRIIDTLVSKADGM